MTEKQLLAIFDLDSTLIRGDSFRALILANMVRSPRLATLTGLRITGLLGRAGFAEKAHKAVLPLLLDSDFLSGFLRSLEGKIYQEVLEMAQSRLAANQNVVLISASPHEYVARFSQQLGFSAGFGSNWRGGNYDHLYGRNKLVFVQREFPRDRFDWVYAISDSRSDDLLLSACDEHRYWNES